MISSEPESNPFAHTRHRVFGHGPEGPPPEFPFERSLSLAGVIAHWEELASRDPAAYQAAWAQLQRDLATAPELSGCIEDPAVLERYADLTARLIRPIFPTSDWTNEAKVISGPFGGLVVARTARYDRVLGHRAAGWLDSVNRHDGYIRTLYAYRAILGRWYQINLRLDQPLIFVVPRESSGLNRYFKLTADTRFVDIEACGEIPALGPADIDELLSNVVDLDVWKRTLPPHLFRFVGVTVVNLTDVTVEMATAAITHMVLTSDANVTEHNFDTIEQEVRNLFGNRDLRMGLASLQADGDLNVVSNRRIWNSLVIRDAVRDGSVDWRKGMYGRALREGRSFMLRDVESADVDEELRAKLLGGGVRSLSLQPLRYDDRTVGLLELSSPEPRAFDASTTLKMARVEPVLALAVSQNLERFETRVESTIQHTYTAIHPSVQWRFRDAAIEMLQSREDTAQPAPIVFTDLHALYGSADIRGSTRQRTEAARRDVVEKLRLAQEALQAVHAAVPLTLLDEMGMRVLRRIERYEDVWSAGDESEAARFLAAEVEPLLRSMTEGREALRPIMARYRNETEAGIGSRTAAYESGRRRVNRMIASLLLREQAEQQKLLPHYFEHAETDGVEHTMYVGQSIAPTRTVDPAYVQNLRLRQLVVACQIGTEVDRLNYSLSHPLDIAQLVVVQHAPVTLRFRTDEKRFDVEGASGVRFEMLKKRLDKAKVTGTEDRVTRPGTVAVAYSTEAEAQEYRRYANYLVGNGFVEPDPEVLDVEDLPGISGLKAMRLRVRTDS